MRSWVWTFQRRGLAPIPDAWHAEGAQCLPLFAPNEELYKMLKGAVMGGPNLVFTRKHEAGKTKIRGHQYVNPKASERVLGYELNTRTMQQDML